MNARRGSFFVIEGTDGSGKGTQCDLLAKRLRHEGYDVEVFDFPRYEADSSYFIRQYLNGKYGEADDVGPYTSSLFFALDRFAASRDIQSALAQGKVVLANRYTGSNMAHQGTKFENRAERRGFFIWLDNLEFELLGIPRPDMYLVLRVPAAIAQTMVDKKEARTYTDKKRDIHEADLSHLQRSVEVYDDLCDLFPKDFQRIDCVRSGKLMDIDTIQTYIWETLEPLLPLPEKPRQNEEKIAMTKKDSNPYITQTESGWDISGEGSTYLKNVLTDSTGDIYAFNDKLTPLTIAAAMARLSRRGDDMRVTLLDEFAQSAEKDKGLLQRVITAYGDDSVQQLVGTHIVIEGASNLLTKQLEWGRLAAYLEQSTRYIYYDQKDQAGSYKYYTPDEFDAATKKLYQDNIDSIFQLYSKMVRQLTDFVRSNSDVPKDEQDGAWKGATRAQACDAVRAVLPVATKSTVGIYGSGQAIESLIMRLRASESSEARRAGDQILKQARQVIPTFLERADKPERGGATTAYIAQTRQTMADLASSSLHESHGDVSEEVRLVRTWPRNELDLLPHMLYEHTNMPLRDIEKSVDSWTIDQKHKAFSTYMGERLNRRHRPGRALEQAHYTWDILCDYGIFRDLQRHRMVDDLEWQKLTPRYGYEIPKLVEDAGLSDEFEQCFDISMQLYSKLVAAGYDYQAQFATLLGHRMRWTVTYNAREAFHIHELRTSPQGHPGYRKLVNQMHQLLSERHPMLGEAMRFVNQDEDPELTRLAAERYTQYKLDNLNT